MPWPCLPTASDERRETHRKCQICSKTVISFAKSYTSESDEPQEMQEVEVQVAKRKAPKYAQMNSQKSSKGDSLREIPGARLPGRPRQLWTTHTWAWASKLAA